jgi:PKD repeat protein
VVTWAQIASGGVDADIRRQAAGIATLGVPVYLTLHHEPDLAQGWGTPAEYRAAWRHYVEVFRAVGVPDVRWTWVVTPGSFGSAPSTAGAAAFYPGDDVVDRVGLDAYNWYGCAPGKPASWRPLSEVVGPFRRWAAERGKIPLLAEVGTAADPADPGRAGAWWTEAVGYLGGWDGLDVVSTFEGTGTCAWAVAGTPATRTALAAAVTAPVAHAVPSASLRADVTVGAAPLTVRLDLGRSTGGGSSTGQGVVAWTLDLGDGTVRTGTGQPGVVAHTFGAGERTARLTVTDAAGRTAVDSVRVVAAAPATVTGAERDVASTTAGLRVWVDPHGVAGRLRIAWGAEGGAEVGAVERDVPAGTSAQAFVQDLTGLTPGTRYVWTATVTTAAGSSTLTRTVDTPGPPTVRALAATGVGRTGATVPVRVHPHSLATVVRVEWLRDGAVGGWSRSADVAMAEATWERSGTVAVTGLDPGVRYRFRVVAGNALGTVTGPEQTLTTAP